MKRNLLAAMAGAIALASAPLALAQPSPNDDHGHDQAQHDQARPPAPHAVDQHAMDQHGQARGPEAHAPMAHEAPRAPEMQHEQAQRGPVHQQAVGHDWHSGERYSGGRDVVHNWSHYHLRRPPHGYEWVQDGNQFVLIAIGTGIIASIIASQSY